MDPSRREPAHHGRWRRARGGRRPGQAARMPSVGEPSSSVPVTVPRHRSRREPHRLVEHQLRVDLRRLTGDRPCDHRIRVVPGGPRRAAHGPVSASAMAHSSAPTPAPRRRRRPRLDQVDRDSPLHAPPRPDTDCAEPRCAACCSASAEPTMPTGADDQQIHRRRPVHEVTRRRTSRHHRRDLDSGCAPRRPVPPPRRRLPHRRGGPRRASRPPTRSIRPRRDLVAREHGQPTATHRRLGRRPIQHLTRQRRSRRTRQ